MQSIHGIRASVLVWTAAFALSAIGAACETSGGEELEIDGGAGDRAVSVSAIEPPGVEAAPELAAPSEAVASASASTERGESLSGPPTDLVPPKPGRAQLVGVVAQRLPAGGYTYLEVAPEHGEPRWVVTMRRGIEAGDRVRVDSLGSRHDFYSRRLDRRFAELVFGVVEVLG